MAVLDHGAKSRIASVVGGLFRFAFVRVEALGAIMHEDKYHAIHRWNEPREGMFQIITNRFWLVDDHGNPLVYAKYNSPQCNATESIVKRLAKGRPYKRLPIVYVPINPSDYV